jgi:hypothetical protein
MVDEMVVALLQWLPQYAGAIPAAGLVEARHGQDAGLGRRGPEDRAVRQRAAELKGAHHSGAFEPGRARLLRALAPGTGVLPTRPVAPAPACCR